MHEHETTTDVVPLTVGEYKSIRKALFVSGSCLVSLVLVDIIQIDGLWLGRSLITCSVLASVTVFFYTQNKAEVCLCKGSLPGCYLVACYLVATWLLATWLLLACYLLACLLRWLLACFRSFAGWLVGCEDPNPSASRHALPVPYWYLCSLRWNSIPHVNAASRNLWFFEVYATTYAQMSLSPSSLIYVSKTNANANANANTNTFAVGCSLTYRY